MQDISDILEGLNRDHDPFATDNYDDGRPSGQADLQALTRAWVNERGTVELLGYVAMRGDQCTLPNVCADGPKTD